jgi:polyisoprenoid-binding protein YceI/rhodanese-related sulfurtransferase
MKSVPQISRDELIARLATRHPPLVIDVLPEEEFKAAHLPGAKNACVFNVTFLDDIKKLVPDRATELVLYGSSARDLASTTAAEKLLAAGYNTVNDYRGGFADWRAAGQPVDGDPGAQVREARPRDGTHQIDVKKSKVEWTGRNLTSEHTGTIKLREGSIEIVDGRLLSGSFTLDMRSIEDVDIEDEGMRQLLVHHLKSDDFFDVQRFPDAEFRVSRIKILPDAKAGNPNCELAGELKMKGVVREIAFRTILGQTPEGVLAADAHFDIDRTKWNVVYGSGKFYEKLGKHLVNDEISLALKLITISEK